MVTRIPLIHLEADPRNPNVCDKETMEKLQANIQQTGFYTPLVVRKHPGKKNTYLIIDGHHRKLALEALGHMKADCQIAKVNEQEAQLLLATLNRLRGTDNIHKRAKLVESLSQMIPVDELSRLLPESRTEIDDLLALLNHDLDEMEKRLKAEIERETKTLPVAFSFLVESKDADLVNQALNQFPHKDRGQALVALCRSVLKRQETA